MKFLINDIKEDKETLDTNLSEVRKIDYSRQQLLKETKESLLFNYKKLRVLKEVIF